MKTIKGDLLKLGANEKFDVIVHGCNCFHTMGGGIALQIRKTFQDAYVADLETNRGDIHKLGTYSSATINIDEHYLVVVNAYTQYDFGTSEMKANYHSIKEVFERIAKDYNGLKIGYPKIGCGLAGGEWSIVSEIIDTALEGQDHTLVEFE